MDILSGPYGTLLEFDTTAQQYGLSAGIGHYYQSKWWSFYSVLHPQGRPILNRIAQEYAQSGCTILMTPTYRWGNHFLRDADDALLCHHRSQVIASDIVTIAQQHHKKVRWSIWPIGDSYTAVWSPRTTWLAYEKQMPIIRILSEAGVDAIIFETAVKKEEILGVIQACKELSLPLVISLYVNPDGYIPEPNGKQTLSQMIQRVDTQCGADGYSFWLNCASKDAIRQAITLSREWLDRITTVYPNASHPTAESYTCNPELCRDTEDLGLFFQELAQSLPSLSVIGGCCGYGPEDMKQLAVSL